MIDLRHGNYQSVLQDEMVDLILTSPPYNIGSKSKKKVGARRLGGFDSKSFESIRGYSDSMVEDKYQDSQVEFLEWCASHLAPNGVLAYSHKPRHKNKRLIHPLEWILRCKSLTLIEEIVWDRGSTHNHSPSMLWQHTERLYIFRHIDGCPEFRNTSDLQFRSDVWYIVKEASKHAAPMPLTLAEATIQAYSRPGDFVMDPYSGSGTTAIAAAMLGRSFVGSERLKKYHTLATKRIEKWESTLTGTKV